MSDAYSLIASFYGRKLTVFSILAAGKIHSKSAKVCVCQGWEGGGGEGKGGKQWRGENMGFEVWRALFCRFRREACKDKVV